MKQEINAAKAIAKQIISATRDYEVDYILSPFNDPRTGPVTHRSASNRASFVTDIDRLRATGGGDCPELSFTGMLNALNQGPQYGSPMFVFTDASAKDDSASNIDSLKAAADLTDATINFFTNLNGCKGAKSVESYKEIASYTGGQVFPLKNEAELKKFTNYVKTSLQQDTVIASGGTLNSKSYKRSLYSMQSHDFMVDDGILMISVAISVQKYASQVTILDPNGRKVNPSTTLSLSLVYQISHPTSGKWTINFPSSVGKYGYNVQAVSSSAIAFAHNFIYQQSVRKNSPPIPLVNPLKGVKNMMVVRLGGTKNFDLNSIKIDLVDTSGNVLQKGIGTDRLDSDEVRHATINPPSVPFKVRLTG